MTQFNLQWSKALLGDLHNHIYAQFFAIVSGGKVVYIGKAFHTDLAETLALALNEVKLTLHQTPDVYLGRLREYGTRHIGKEILESLHQLLVFATRPLLNREDKLCYTGLSDLHLAHTGFDLVPGKMRAENQRVFLSKVPVKISNSYQPAIAG